MTVLIFSISIIDEIMTLNSMRNISKYIAHIKVVIPAFAASAFFFGRFSAS